MSTTTNPQQRYAAGTFSAARRYQVSKTVLKEIRKCCPIYGSQARVLQVGTEILIRQKKPIKLTYTVKRDEKEVRISYKLLPRTIELIDKLTPVYGSNGKVMAACVEVLREE
jgi:hypothetical protein